ncbi:MAG: DMT family transporter [Granulosicoccus sp.]
MKPANERSGVVYMLGAMFLFATADAHAKYLTAYFHPTQIIWFRQLGLVIGVLYLIYRHGSVLFVTQQRSMQICRGILVVLSSVLFVSAIKYVALADAVAASFVAPFFVTIFGVLILGEKVGIRRWAAVVLGFIGAFIIVRPGLGLVHPAALLVVLAAAIYAMRQVIGRYLSRSDKTLTTITYTALTSGILISIPLPWFWKTPEALSLWMLLISMSVLAGIGEVLLISALEAAKAATVAPIHYTLIIWGTGYGYLFFNQFPDRWTWVGTAIIVAAGMYNLRREKLKHPAL